MVKTNTISSVGKPDTNKPRIKALPGEEMLHSWIAEVQFWQEEISFYHRFLTLGLTSVPHELVSEVNQLQQAFQSYHKDLLPAFIRTLEELQQRGAIEQEVSQAVTGKLFTHRQKLRELKKRLFPLFGELFHCEIW